MNNCSTFCRAEEPCTISDNGFCDAKREEAYIAACELCSPNSVEFQAALSNELKKRGYHD